jgi:CheY-like chemotaxis protein
MRTRAREKGITFAVEVSGEVPATINSDPTRVRQILLNLVSNAVKFTDRGSVRLTISLDRAAPKPSLSFDVIDTGIGIDAASRAEIFQPFMHSRSASQGVGGTGLGLAISKRLAVLLGGDLVLVAATPGEGTHLRATIASGPLDGVRMVREMDATPVEAKPEGDDADGQCLSLAGRRVLLAEDGFDNQRLITRILRRAGADVAVVENGQLAVEAVEAAITGGWPVDIVLMDMQMPVMDGYAATAIHHERHRDLPVIALTAHALVGQRETCIVAGCTEYLTKPIDRRALVAAIAAHVPCKTLAVA